MPGKTHCQDAKIRKLLGQAGSFCKGSIAAISVYAVLKPLTSEVLPGSPARPRRAFRVVASRGRHRHADGRGSAQRSRAVAVQGGRQLGLQPGCDRLPQSRLLLPTRPSEAWLQTRWRQRAWNPSHAAGAPSLAVLIPWAQTRPAGTGVHGTTPLCSPKLTFILPNTAAMSQDSGFPALQEAEAGGPPSPAQPGPARSLRETLFQINKIK